ncbi:glycosyltransferase family 4 protein [Flavobacteriaceae bacterium]|nr:glycosyltransferase family 4 protein [Flavobacteriaceae bacterium]MDC3297674.1 glycosyltransferase family 4 protein [Flavobacteriaceae bacterium]
MAKKINKKRILIHSLVFSPDGVSTAYLYNDIALELQKNGYAVTVLTTTPHYNLIKNNLANQPLTKRFLGLFYTSNFNGILVYHIPLKKFKSSILRIISFIYWHSFSLFLSFFIKKIDFILTPSPPLTAGLISVLIAKIKNAKCIYNVQEIYPDLLIKHGSLNNRLIIKILKIIESRVYDWSNAITTIDYRFYNKIKTRVKDQNKLHVIPNFVDANFYNIESSVLLPKKFTKKEGNINMLYAGNIGLAQEWDLILNLAKEIENDPIIIWIVGEGVKKSYLESYIRKNKLNNINLLPYQDRKFMPSINLFADFHFIAMNKNMENEGFPSKIYSIMSSGRPMVVVSSKGTPIVSFLEKTNTALIVPDHSLIGFKNAVLKLSSDNKLRKDLGNSGRKIIEQKFTKKHIINQYLELIENI